MISRGSRSKTTNERYYIDIQGQRRHKGYVTLTLHLHRPSLHQENKKPHKKIALDYYK